MAPEGVFSGKENSPLETRLDVVDVDSLSVRDAAEKICRQAGVAERSHRIIGPPQEYGLVSLHLKNVTVREALNAVVRTDGQSMWILKATMQPRIIQINSWRASKPGAFSKEGGVISTLESHRVKVKAGNNNTPEEQVNHVKELSVEQR